MKNRPLKFNLKCKFSAVILLFLIILLGIFLPSQKIEAKESTQFNRDLKNYNAKLTIFDVNNKQSAQFLVAIANSDAKRAYGLMNLSHLPADYGMIFLFEQSQIVKMWMKNTQIPLDMIFINKNNQIVNIKTNSRPYSLDIISSKVEIDKVLEINAGLVEKLGIKIGHKIAINL